MNINLKFLLFFYLLKNNSYFENIKNHKKKIIFIILTLLILKKSIDKLSKKRNNNLEKKNKKFSTEEQYKESEEEQYKESDLKNIKDIYNYFLENNNFNIKEKENDNLNEKIKILLAKENDNLNKNIIIINLLIKKLEYLKIKINEINEINELIKKFNYLKDAFNINYEYNSIDEKIKNYFINLKKDLNKDDLEKKNSIKEEFYNKYILLEKNLNEINDDLLKNKIKDILDKIKMENNSLIDYLFEDEIKNKNFKIDQNGNDIKFFNFKYIGKFLKELEEKNKNIEFKNIYIKYSLILDQNNKNDLINFKKKIFNLTIYKEEEIQINNNFLNKIFEDFKNLYTQYRENLKNEEEIKYKNPVIDFLKTKKEDLLKLNKDDKDML